MPSALQQLHGLSSMHLQASAIGLSGQLQSAIATMHGEAVGSLSSATQQLVAEQTRAARDGRKALGEAFAKPG